MSVHRLPASRPSAQVKLPCLCALPLLLATASAGQAQVQGYGQTIDSPQQQRELDAGSGGPSRNSALDATNPIDLMNRLRRASAFDNATPPSDAIDAALRDFQPQPQQVGPGSGLIQAP
ncbi:MAG: hypothetical protein ACKO50_02955 [Cyanobium sp.]